MVLLVFQTHLKRASLVSKAVEDAWAGAKNLVHAFVCALQVGIKLKSIIYWDWCICILHTNEKELEHKLWVCQFACVRVYWHWWWKCVSWAPPCPSPEPRVCIVSAGSFSGLTANAARHTSAALHACGQTRTKNRVTNPIWQHGSLTMLHKA